jgi:hypothetical protein
MEYIAAVDPGREKCGLALMSTAGEVIEQRVVPRREALTYLSTWHRCHPLKTIVLGNRTGSRQFAQEIEESPLGARVPISLVEEHLSTLEARERYFTARPPRGWRRLIPVSLQVPPEPYDDFVAVILGERYLKGRRT